jgi:DNA-binding MarR family transcriptional regulator
MTQKNEPKNFIIPRILFYLKDLTIMEKFLLTEIYHLDNKDGCFASNKRFASTLNIKIGSVTNMLMSLRKKGLIEYDDEKRTRTLHVTEVAKLLFGDLHWLMEGASIEGWRDLHRLMDNNTTLNLTPKKDIGKESNRKGPDPLKGLSQKIKEQVMDVYDFWNSYKGDGFHSHNRLTHDMVLAITENLKHYTVEDMCIAITNYVTVIQDETCLLSHKWALATFFTVGKNSSKDSPRKWWRFLPDNFSIDNHRRSPDRSPPPDQKIETREESLILSEKDDVILIQEIITKYCRLIGSKLEEYDLNVSRHNKFILASRMMTQFFSRGKGRIAKDTWVDTLMECLQENRVNKSEIVHPGHLCAANTWDTLMPQHLRELGVWYE